MFKLHEVSLRLAAFLYPMTQDAEMALFERWTNVTKRDAIERFPDYEVIVANARRSGSTLEVQVLMLKKEFEIVN